MEASEPADGGIGLPMIRALSNSVELRDLGGDGTELGCRKELGRKGVGAGECS